MSGEGGDFCGGGKEAGEVGFEGALVDVAYAGWLANGLIHDVRRGGREEEGGDVEEAGSAGFPFGGRGAAGVDTGGLEGSAVR